MKSPLKIIKIEKPKMSFDTRLNPNAVEDYERWKKESYAKIGYIGSKYLSISVDDSIEFSWHKKSLYMKRSLKGLFYWVWAKDEETEKGVPSIICGCGGEVFELRYGDYEMFARCPQCGCNDSVYSG